MSRFRLHEVVFMPLLALAMHAQSPMHEEQVVQQSYGKVSYLMGVNVVTQNALSPRVSLGQTASDFSTLLQTNTATFELADFKVGNVSEIASVPWAELVTPEYKIRSVLNISIETQAYKDDDSATTTWVKAGGAWQNARADDVGGLQLAWLQKPVQTYIGAEFSGITVNRYASFSVTPRFQGKTAGPYRAMFLFGRDKAGNEIVVAEDQGLKGSALQYAISADLYPYGLLRTHLREQKVVSDWLTSVSVEGGECNQEKAAVCCSQTSCGLAAGQIKREMLTPISRWSE